MQHRPRQPGVLGGNGHHGLPIPSSFDQTARPATEAVLLVAQTGQDGAGAHHQQAAQVSIPGLGDSPQSGFTTTAVLPRYQPDPRRDLATVPEVVAVANTGQEGTGRHWADAAMFHQAFAARVFTGGFDDGFVVVRDLRIELVSVRQEVADTLVGVARQVFEVFSNTPAQAGQCAPERASIPIRHGGSWAISDGNCSRATFGLMSTAFPL